MRAREFSIRRIMCFLWISDYYNQMLRAGEKVWAFSARVKRTHAARASTHRKVERFLHEGQTPSFPSGANAERRWSPQKLTLQCGQVKIVLTVMPHRGQVCTPFIILKFSIFWSLQIQRTGRKCFKIFLPLQFSSVKPWMFDRQTLKWNPVRMIENNSRAPVRLFLDHFHLPFKVAGFRAGYWQSVSPRATTSPDVGPVFFSFAVSRSSRSPLRNTPYRVLPRGYCNDSPWFHLPSIFSI